jgi:hypothetical protein
MRGPLAGRERDHCWSAECDTRFAGGGRWREPNCLCGNAGIADRQQVFDGAKLQTQVSRSLDERSARHFEAEVESRRVSRFRADPAAQHAHYGERALETTSVRRPLRAVTG